MSIRDAKCIFPAYALSKGAGASDVIKTDVKGDAYIGLWLVIRSVEAASGGTKVVIRLQTAGDEAFTSPKDLFITPELAVAALAEYTEHVKVRLPLGCDRFLRLKFDTTGTFTAGSVEGYLTPDVNI